MKYKLNKEGKIVKQLILAIDFDGTIVEHQYPNIGKEIPNAIYFLKKIQEMGHTLILWTCREGLELALALDYCRKKGLHFDAVNKNAVDMGDNLAKSKIYYDCCIDDKNFDAKIDWKDIYNKIKDMTGI